MSAFPAAPYSAVVFPEDEFLVIPMALVEADVPPGAVRLWLLLARLAEGHAEVEVSTVQLEQHTGWPAAEIGGHVRALSADGWVTTSKGRVPSSCIYRLQRMPTVEQVKEWAEDLAEPWQSPTTTATRPSGHAGQKPNAAFWRGSVADPLPQR
ncbi:hypothetical protein DKM19_27440 [Streptosporangium sp. 'caverna']|nr:hypothetical protein DKM19_27440 [Streptosporangium sp. 'caverna']